MAVTARHSSASTFGETDFDTDDLKTPSLIEDISYRATARCPSNAPNQLCKIEVAARNGVTITKEITPAQQTGPTAMQEVSPGVCQWYDSDPWHPMAAVGLGACNNAMTGLGRPDTYNFGPSECVVDQYLDQHGCPADTIQSQQLVQAGWNWAPFLANKKRFAHEVVAGVAKCFDFTDCFCTGCGHTFKTDTTQGWGFTGYGYFANGQWAPFAKPFDQMTGSEKARQCSAAFASQGWTCPASSVNLVCFRAGAPLAPRSLSPPQRTCRSVIRSVISRQAGTRRSPVRGTAASSRPRTPTRRLGCTRRWRPSTARGACPEASTRRATASRCPPRARGARRTPPRSRGCVSSQTTWATSTPRPGSARTM